MALEEEELLLKQLPHSVEAEQAVLGSMLIDPRCVPDVIEQLRPEDFYNRQNREIYETIYSMFNFSLTIDPVTVLENMRKNGVYDENVSRNYILQLMDTTPTAANVGEYVAIIKDKTLLRRIAETAGDMTAMVQQGTDSGQDVLEAAGVCRMSQWTLWDVPCTYPLLERMKLEVAATGGVVRDAEYGADITLRTAFPAGAAETFQLRLTELSAGSLTMTAAGEEFLPGPQEEAN